MMLAGLGRLLLIMLATLGPGLSAHQLVYVDLKSTPGGGLLYAEVDIGLEVEAQTFKLAIATQYQGVWLLSAGLIQQRGYRTRNKTANREEDEHYISINGHPFAGSTHHDRMRLGPIVIDEQALSVLSAYGHTSPCPCPEGIDGILGLAADFENSLGLEYPFKSLYRLDHIGRLAYSIYFNNTAIGVVEDEGVKGSLVFGGADGRYYTGDMNYAKMYLDHPDLSANSSISSFGYGKNLMIFSITLDWSRANESNSSSPGRRHLTYDHQTRPLKLDSSMKLFAGPSDVLNRLMVEEMGARLLTNDDIYIFADCRVDNKPDLVFSLGTMEVTVTPEDYVIAHEFQRRPVCLSAFLGQHRQWTFGTRFLRKYYTLVDYETDLVGFAKPV